MEMKMSDLTFWLEGAKQLEQSENEKYNSIVSGAR